MSNRLEFNFFNPNFKLNHVFQMNVITV